MYCRRQSLRPYCDGLPQKLLDTGCSDHHDALTYCAIVRYDTDIPLTYRVSQSHAN